LVQAGKELLDILAAIQKPDAPLVPGDYCKFCPAKFKCPAIKNTIETISTSREHLEGITGPALAKFLELCAIADPVIKSIRALAKDRLKESLDSVPGWTLSKPANVRTISDPFAVFKVLLDAKLITREQFLSDCVSVGIGDLEKALAKVNAMKPAQAKETVNSVCAEFIEVKQKEPSLEQL